MLDFLAMINPCLILLALVPLWRRLLNSGGIFKKELNATLKIGNLRKVSNQVLSLSMIVLNLLWMPMFFQKFSTKYGLDSEIVASFCESFATHVDLPKEKWFKYHPPIK